MRLQRAYTVPKVSDLPNEDRFASSDVAHALSDGASISYDSALWAGIICSAYVQNPHVSPEWLSGCIAEFNAQHDRASLPWYKEAALDRGSFASLLGVSFTKTAIRIDAVGDSIAVLCDGVAPTDSFPYRTPDQFDQEPLLLSTDPAKNPIFPDGKLSSDCVCQWQLEQLGSPQLICMTDALGRWLLASEDPEAVARLLSLESDEAFAAFVIAEREAGRLKRDDTTMLMFR